MRHRHPPSAGVPMPRSVPILMYHAIAPVACAREAAYTTPPDVFARQMQYLHRRGYLVLSVGELMRRLDRNETLPDRTLALSVDDGFACAHDAALPILQTYGHGATVYVISGYLDRMARFDLDLGIPARPMLARSQVQALHAAGIEIGAHTVNHVDLRTLSASALRNELERSRHDLQDLIGAPVDSFAYPRGLFDRTVQRAVQEANYRSACSTLPGSVSVRTDRLALRRAQIGHDPHEAAFEAILRWGSAPSRLVRSAVRGALVAVCAPIIGVDPMDCRLRPLRQSLRRATSG